VAVVIAGIGYQGRSADELVARLRSAGIELLIDVRELPWSRKAGFSKTQLAAILGAAGIDYVHLRAAGNPKRNRAAAATPAASLAGYRAHLLAHSAVLDEIRALAEARPAALLCYEAEHDQCHRSVILDVLAERGADVEVRRL
jgi:uncharacterized protein (DUF488 family)